MLLFGLMCLCLILIAIIDYLYFIIPDGLTFFLFVIFIFYLSWQLPAIPHSRLMIPAAIMILGYALSHLNILGYGDSKLISALFFGLGSGSALKFFLATSIFGGIHGLFVLILKKYDHRLRLKLIQNPKVNFVFSFFIPELEGLKKEIINGDLDRYIPYGVAICFGGIYALYPIALGAR